MASGNVQAVVTFGQMARKAWEVWKQTPAGAMRLDWSDLIGSARIHRIA
jgi:hypothetical protein